jgi:hypothetical protein
MDDSHTVSGALYVLDRVVRREPPAEVVAP